MPATQSAPGESAGQLPHSGLNKTPRAEQIIISRPFHKALGNSLSNAANPGGGRPAGLRRLAAARSPPQPVPRRSRRAKPRRGEEHGLLRTARCQCPSLSIPGTQTCLLIAILALVLHSDCFISLQPFPLLFLIVTLFHRIHFLNLYFSECLQAAVSCPSPLTSAFKSAVTTAERIIHVPQSPPALPLSKRQWLLLSVHCQH